MNPSQPAPSSNPQIQAAVSLHVSGKLVEAAEQMRKLLTLYPKNTQLLTHLGTIYLQQGQTELGISTLAKSLHLDVNQPMAWFNRANGLVVSGKLEEALEDYNRTIAVQPNHIDAHYSRANVLRELNRPEEALASYDRVIVLKPDLTGAHHNRGMVLEKLGRSEEALASYERVIALEPNRSETYNNRGVVLRKLNWLEESLAEYDRAIALKKDYAEAHNNRGVVLQELRRLPEALESYDRAIAIKPDYAEAYWNKAQLKNLTGDYAEGWKLFEWRWKGVQKDQSRSFAQPLWRGQESLAGKTILIHSEQGLGDVFQFCRYVPMVEQLGAQVVFEVPRALVSILSTLPGKRTLVEKGKPLPVFDLHCPLMSLPLAFQTTAETIPATVPYLFADPGKKEMWQKKLGNKTRPRVGLVWAGRPDQPNDHNRRIPLEKLAPLFELPYEFHSLKKDYQESDRVLLPRYPVQDHQADLHDFADTAALIEEMDLVLSVDTSVPHLVGAMGKALFVLLCYVPDYRWLLERTDSPWYSTATLFRQSQTGDWDSVVKELAIQLKARFK